MKIYDRLPNEWHFFPESAKPCNPFRETVTEIIRNWKKIKNNTENERMTAFLDPPTAKRPASVRLTIMESGNKLKPAFVNRINQASGGIKLQLSQMNQSGVRAGLYKELKEFCVTWYMDIPVWVHRQNGIKEITLELIEFISMLYENNDIQNPKELFFTLRDAVNHESNPPIIKNLNRLWDDVSRNYIDKNNSWINRIDKTIRRINPETPQINVFSAQKLINAITCKPAYQMVSEAVNALGKKGKYIQEIILPQKKDIPDHFLRLPRRYLDLRHCLYLILGYASGYPEQKEKRERNIRIFINESENENMLNLDLIFGAENGLKNKLLLIETRLRIWNFSAYWLTEDSGCFRIELPVMNENK